MKIKILKNIDIDIDKTRLQEVWPKYLSKNDIFDVEKVESISDSSVNLVLSDGDILLEVPKTAFVPLRWKKGWLSRKMWYSEYVVWINTKHKK